MTPEEIMERVKALAESAEQAVSRISVLESSMKQYMAFTFEKIKTQNEKTANIFLDALAEIQSSKAQDSGQENVIDDLGLGGSKYSQRYRNDTLRASLGYEVPDPPIHRLEWIAKATAYDPSTITEENPTGDEWANELWSPVLHGEAEL